MRRLKRIKYTEDMRDLDRKLEKGSSINPSDMKKLMDNIYITAIKVGFDQDIDIVINHKNEAIATVSSIVFKNNEVSLNNKIFKGCKPLVEFINSRLEMIELINYITNNEDLFDKKGVSLEEFYTMMQDKISFMFNDEPNNLSIHGAFDNIEDVIAYLPDLGFKDLNIDNIYDLLCDNDIYIIYINDKEQYFIIEN